LQSWQEYSMMGMPPKAICPLKCKWLPSLTKNILSRPKNISLTIDWLLLS
jgi:hypothetical protein